MLKKTKIKILALIAGNGAGGVPAVRLLPFSCGGRTVGSRH